MIDRLRICNGSHKHDQMKRFIPSGINHRTRMSRSTLKRPTNQPTHRHPRHSSRPHHPRLVYLAAVAAPSCSSIISSTHRTTASRISRITTCDDTDVAESILSPIVTLYTSSRSDNDCPARKMDAPSTPSGDTNGSSRKALLSSSILCIALASFCASTSLSSSTLNRRRRRSNSWPVAPALLSSGGRPPSPRFCPGKIDRRVRGRRCIAAGEKASMSGWRWILKQ
mmetsp:Transcript_1404/g.3050  ORF Transcript_1404/g.3050 Transcript_1404/m.3050 type:complete len:225 (+) Transcript_1404:653-1327(+)